MDTQKHQIRFSSDSGFQNKFRSLQARILTLGLSEGRITQIVSFALASVAAKEVVHWIECASCCDMSAELAKAPLVTFVRLSDEDMAHLRQLMGEVMSIVDSRITMRSTVHNSICAISDASDEDLTKLYKLYQFKTKRPS